jgi:DNA topoisomerase-3
VDVGDHPPITPVRLATEAELGGGSESRIYNFVARHFLGSLSPDCVVRKTRAAFTVGSEAFSASGITVVRPGFTAIMHWKVSEHLGCRCGHACGLACVGLDVLACLTWLLS